MIELYEGQKIAIEKLGSGSVLWGGVGTGKSLTSLAYYYIKECNNMKNPKPLVIITTARKRDTFEWDKECAKMYIDKSQYTVDSWNNIGKYLDRENNFFIFDEQRLVSFKKWAKTFIKITKKNRWILLTATPADCWMDYLSIFIANGFYKTKYQFEQEHVLYSRFSKYPQITGYRGIRKLEAYRDKILVPMTVEKETVPHSIEVMCEYNTNRYLQVVRTRWDPFKNEPIQDAGALCYVLRKVVNSDSRRLEQVMQILMKHGKAIIFYNYDYELYMLRELDWPHSEWNGHLHEPIPSTGHWAYFVQYAAGAEGWNCVETDTIIFFSRNYSYKTMFQAAGRIDRLNTAYHDLYYYYLITNSKIDIAIGKALKQKKTFNDSAFVGKFYIRKPPPKNLA